MSSSDQSKVNRPRIMVEKVHNMTGSTAGAGSGEFHNYSQHKQRERARLAQMDFEARKDQRDQRFSQKEQAFSDKSDKETQKKRNDRMKKKINKKIRKIRKGAIVFNKFANDGSFLEQFKKQQESQPTGDDEDSNSSAINSENEGEQSEVQTTIQEEVTVTSIQKSEQSDTTTNPPQVDADTKEAIESKETVLTTTNITTTITTASATEKEIN